MKIIPAVLAFVTLALLETSLATSLFADQAYAFQPENPVTSEWLTQHLRRESPKLILTPDRLNKLKSSIVYSLHNHSHLPYCTSPQDWA